MKVTTTAMAVLMLAAATPAAAQEVAPVVGGYGLGGSMEVVPHLALGYPDGGDFDIMPGASFHYFVIDGLAIGGGFRVGAQLNDPVYPVHLQFAAQAEYNFLLGSVMPYVGLGLGVDVAFVEVCVPDPWTGGETCASGDDAAFLLHPGGGVKFPVADSMAVGVGLDFPLSIAEGGVYYQINVLGSFAITF